MVFATEETVPDEPGLLHM